MGDLGRYMAAKAGWSLARGMTRLTWRWWTGAPLDGKPRTNAGWFVRGDEVTSFALNKRASRWAYLPRVTRAGIRAGVLLVALVELYGLIAWPTTTRVLDVAAVAAGVAYTARRAWVAWRTRVHRRTVVRPLATALAPRLSIRAGTKPEAWLSIPRDYATNHHHPVVIALPQGFDRDGHGDAVTRLALDRLRIDEPIVSWRNWGDTPTLAIGTREAIRTLVTFEQVRAAMLTASSTTIVLGMGPGEKIVSASIDLDSPHVALSAPSNSGKSVAAGAIVAQQMHKGAASLVFDIKAESHTWAFDLPNAVVFTDEDKIHYGLIAVWDIVKDRQQQVKAAAKAHQPRPVFNRIWVVIEELNLTRKALARMWELYRAEDPERAKKLPKTSPALEVIGSISFAGRSVGVNAILVAQRLTAAATGDNTGAVRENMGIRYMIKPRTATWKMLADGAELPRFLKGIKGRAHVVIDGHAEEVQGVYMMDAELRDLATSGVVFDVPQIFAEIDAGTVRMVLSGQAEGATEPQPDAVRTAPGGQPQPAIEAHEVTYITIEEAVAEKLFSQLPESVKRTLRRDAKNSRPGTPESMVVDGARKYDRDELIAWRDSRAGSDFDEEGEIRGA